MRSEKLKQLIKDKVPLKFRIKDEQQSKELQDFMFAMDITWEEGEFGKSLPSYQEKPYIFVGKKTYKFGIICKELFSKTYNIMWDDSKEFFEESIDYKEFDLENDCLVEECKWPNLRKLIEAKTPLKFRIKNEEQKKEFQEFMFKQGVYWHDGSRSFYKTDAELFMLETDGHYGFFICRLSSESYYFKNFNGKEFDLANDCFSEEEIEKARKEVEDSLYESDRAMLEEVSKILMHIKENMEKREETRSVATDILGKTWTSHTCCSDNTGIGLKYAKKIRYADKGLGFTIYPFPKGFKFDETNED